MHLCDSIRHVPEMSPSNPPAPHVLLLAALRDELEPTVSALQLQWSTGGGAAKGEFEGIPTTAAATGMGAARVTAAASKLVDTEGPSAILLLGLAGGLDPGLKAAEVRRIVRILDEHGGAYALQCGTVPQRQEVDEPAAADTQHDDGAAATLLSVDTVISSVEQKAELFGRYGAAMVDMESAALARLALQRGLPLTVLRAVSDPADQVLPPQAVTWVREDGSIDTRAAMMFLATHPWMAGKLMSLRRHAQAAAQALAGAVGDVLRTMVKPLADQDVERS